MHTTFQYDIVFCHQEVNFSVFEPDCPYDWLCPTECDRSDVVWRTIGGLNSLCSFCFHCLQNYCHGVRKISPISLIMKAYMEKDLPSWAQLPPNEQADAVMWVSPGKTSRIAQPSHRIMKNNTSCYFKVLSFEFVSYTTIDNWYSLPINYYSAQLEWVLVVCIFTGLLCGLNVSLFVKDLPKPWHLVSAKQMLGIITWNKF